MAPKSKPQVKLERQQKYETRMFTAMIQSQQTDASGDLADTLLICNGGTLRVHAFLLQSASPFIQKAIFSQGESYPHIREILLPDFSLKDVERMVSLIYKGYADLGSNEEDVKSLKEVLNFFEISGVEETNGASLVKTVKGNLKVQELNRIPQDIFKQDRKLKLESVSPVKAVSVNDAAKPKVAAVVKDKQSKKKAKPATEAEPVVVRRSGRAPKTIRNLANDDDENKSDNDSDFVADPEPTPQLSDEEMSDSDSRSRPLKRGRRAAKQPVVRLPRILRTEEPKTKSASSSDDVVVIAEPEEENPDEDNTPVGDIPSEDLDWKKPNFKDKEWFNREAKICQCCKKKFDKPSEASICVTAHKKLRCYFCFRVYSSTDVLFKHFRIRHRQAGRENTLICPYCDQSVPYKSVSCHVISVHLREGEGKDKPISKPASSSTPKNNGPGRSASIISNSSGSGSKPSKRSSHSRSISTDRDKSPEKHPSKKSKRHVSPSPKKKSKQDSDKKYTHLIKKFKEVRGLQNERETMLQVPDLDVTIEKMSAFGDGRKFVFRIQKSRSLNLENGQSST